MSLRAYADDVRCVRASGDLVDEVATADAEVVSLEGELEAPASP